ncbi:MAG: branched-chain amino acid ABC transporter permease [Dehalococcoidia bacterium]
MIRGLLSELRWGVLPVPGRVLGIAFFVFLYLVPLMTNDAYIMRLMTIAAILAIFAVSWDVLSGYSGQVNFGHALFFGAGAYGAALLYRHAGLQPWATIPLGAIIATGIGVATCFPALRLRPPYLSLLTLAFPIIAERIIRSMPNNWAGGNDGIRGMPALAGTADESYYICLIVMTISVLIMYKLTDAKSKYVRTGLLFHAIREDEIAARATGIDTVRYKILAFVIGGFFAGLAGALYAHFRLQAGPTYFSTLLSFQAIIWVVFGGIVSIYGPIVGVYSVYVGLDFLRKTPIGEYRLLIMTGVIILILLFMPEGIAVRIRQWMESECPRCKLTNASWRRRCRACDASLHYVPQD